jgi:UDP-3-O-acyl-N-acetylglucosamine deacetylase
MMIEISGDEVPIPDGDCAQIVKIINNAGTAESVDHDCPDS